jgi:hypothetical protein
LMEAKGPVLRRQLEHLPQQTQDDLDGGFGEDLAYPVWLQRESPASQREILGPTRYRLFHAGKLTLQQMVNQDGRPWTLEELARQPVRRRVA